jgi:hypothetical protein
MMTYLIVLMEIMCCKRLEGGLNQALADYSDRLLDLSVFAGEMMAAAESARH